MASSDDDTVLIQETDEEEEHRPRKRLRRRNATHITKYFTPPTIQETDDDMADGSDADWSEVDLFESSTQEADDEKEEKLACPLAQDQASQEIADLLRCQETHPLQPLTCPEAKETTGLKVHSFVSSMSIDETVAAEFVDGIFMCHRKRGMASSCVGTGPQSKTVEFADVFGYPFVCQYVSPKLTTSTKHTIFNTYKYAAFHSADAIRAFILSKEGSYKVPMFEVIRSDTPCRLYFDIDMLLDNKPDDGIEGVLAQTAVNVASDLLLEYQVPIEFAKFLVLKDRSSQRGEKGYKISFHLIFPYIIFKNNHNGHMKAWAHEFDVRLTPLFCKITGTAATQSVVDQVVYTRNRLMCLLFCIKPSSDIEEFSTFRPFEVHPLSSTYTSTDLTQFKYSLIGVSCFFRSLNEGKMFMVQSHSIKDGWFLNNDECEKKDEDKQPLNEMTANIEKRPVPAHTRLPHSEKKLVDKWAHDFFISRLVSRGVCADDRDKIMIDTGNWTLKNHLVYLSMPCDNFCVMKKRPHNGQSAHTQTSYVCNLLTSEFRQNCFSCPNIDQWSRMSKNRNYDIFNVLTSGTDIEIASAIAEEMNVAGNVLVFAMTRDRLKVYIFDKTILFNGTYNRAMCDTCLWISGDISYLKIAIVIPWLERKFLLLENCKNNAAREKVIQKAKKKRMNATATSALSTITAQLLVNRAKPALEHTFNQASANTIATNDGMELHLETLEVTPREPSSMFTITTNFRLLDMNVQENKDRVQRFDDFVLGVMSYIDEKKEYLHRIYGYCLTCDHVDRRFYAHIGCGSNGKTSVESCIENAMGPYHKNVRSSFTTKKSSSSSTECTTDIMALTNARFISANETSQGAHMDQERLKRVAEGGKHSGRALYESETEVRLGGKMHIYSNFMLKFAAQDLAVVDRLAIVTYSQRYVNNPMPGTDEVKRDPALIQTFMDDPDAVGTWLALGAQKALADIQMNGEIVMPDIVKNATKKEIKKMDTIATFVESRVEFHRLVVNTTVQKSSSAHRIISKKMWTWDKEAMFTCFSSYLQNSGCTDRYDAGNFNNCLDRYFINNRYAIRTLQQDGRYFWWGLRQQQHSEEGAGATMTSFYREDDETVRRDDDKADKQNATAANSLVGLSWPRDYGPTANKE